MDSQKRTIFKTLSWRVVATIITMFVAYGATGQAELSLGIGLSDTFIKLFAYYGHERFWNKLKFGKLETSFGKSGGGI